MAVIPIYRAERVEWLTGGEASLMLQRPLSDHDLKRRKIEVAEHVG